MNDEKIDYQCPKCVVCSRAEVMVLDKVDIDRWKAGEHVQNVWPWMTPDNRELLISGTHPKCWDKLMGTPDEEPGGEECAHCGRWNFYQEADVGIGMYWGFTCDCGKDTCHQGTYEDFRLAMGL